MVRLTLTDQIRFSNTPTLEVPLRTKEFYYIIITYLHYHHQLPITIYQQYLSTYPVMQLELSPQRYWYH